MPKYVPTVISYSNHGLTKNANAFVIADDAYTELENAFVWRGRIRRRFGSTLLGRFRRVLTAFVLTNQMTSTGVPFTFPLFGGTTFTGEANASLEPGNITTITISIANAGAATLTRSPWPVTR